MNYKERLSKILEGIDKDECESKDGWWETSTGAEFGEGKKKELEDFIRQELLTQLKEIREEMPKEKEKWCRPSENMIKNKTEEVAYYNGGFNEYQEHLSFILNKKEQELK